MKELANQVASRLEENDKRIRVELDGDNVDYSTLPREEAEAKHAQLVADRDERVMLGKEVDKYRAEVGKMRSSMDKAENSRSHWYEEARKAVATIEFLAASPVRRAAKSMLKLAVSDDSDEQFNAAEDHFIETVRNDLGV